MGEPKIDQFRKQSAEQRNWFLVRDTANALRRYRRPSALNEKQRAARRECRVCFYLRGGRVAGQAFTDYVCGVCGTTGAWSNTAIPAACDSCSDTNRLCQRCYGDRDIKPVKITKPSRKQ